MVGLLLLAGCPQPQPLNIQPPTLPDAVEESFYEALLAADSSGDQRWQVVGGALPPGLRLEEDSGLLHGTPAAPGDYDFEIEVADPSPWGGRSGQRSYSLHVIPRLRLGASLPQARAGVPYAENIPISGGVPPYQISVVGLPAGLSYDPEHNTIAGTPPPETASPAVPLDITAVDSGSFQQVVGGRIHLVIKPLPVMITSTELPDGEVNRAYIATLAAVHGLPPYRWQVAEGLLPDGLRLNVATGVISGLPTQDETRTITVRVTDSDVPPTSDSAAFTIAIEP